MKKFIQDLLVTAIAGVTSLLTAIILVVVEQKFNFAFYSYMWWFVIPIGAIGSGYVAASGYYLGSKLFNHKPTKLILINMLAISTVTFFLIYFLNYMSYSINGKYISNYISFFQFLDLSLSHMSMNVCVHYVNCGGNFQLGSFGYIVGILQILGFFVGGASIYGYLSSEIYCDNCLRYYSSKKSQNSYFSDSDTITKHFVEIVDMLKNNKLQEAIDKHAVSGAKKAEKGLILRSTIVLKYCSKCLKHYLRFSLYKLVKNEWKEIDKTRIAFFTEKQLNLVNKNN